MKQLYLIHEHHPRLLLFFAGWAADETPFRHYRPQGMDYQICYDYRTLDFDAAPLRGTARHSARHLPRYARRTDGRLAPQVPAPHVCRQHRLPPVPRTHAPPPAGRDTRRAGLHRPPRRRAARRHADVDRSRRGPRRPHHPARQPADGLVRAGYARPRDRRRALPGNPLQPYRWTNA